MTSPGPRDDSEEGEVRQEPYRYPAFEGRQGSGRGRDTPTATNNIGPDQPLFQPRRGTPSGDGAWSRDRPAKDVDTLRKELQGALSEYARQGRTLQLSESARVVLDRFIGSQRGSIGGTAVENQWDRDREYAGSRGARGRSPDRDRPRLSDDRYRRGDDYDRDRDRSRTRDPPFSGRDRGYSGGGSGVDAPSSGRSDWYGNGRYRDGPVSERGDEYRRPSAGVPTIQSPRRMMMSGGGGANTGYTPTAPGSTFGYGSNTRSGGSHGPPPVQEDWKRKREKLMSEGPAALHGRGTQSSNRNGGDGHVSGGIIGSPPAPQRGTARGRNSPLFKEKSDPSNGHRVPAVHHVNNTEIKRERSPLKINTNETDANDVEGSRSGDMMMSPPKLIQLASQGSSDSVTSNVHVPHPDPHQLNAGVDDSATLYTVSDEEDEGEELGSGENGGNVVDREGNEVTGATITLQPFEEVMDGLSVERLVDVLEELERTERALGEQIRGLKHDVDDKNKQLAKVRHVQEKQAQRAAKREEQARLTLEERTRIAVTTAYLKELRRTALSSTPTLTSPLQSAFREAAQQQQSAGTANVLWTMWQSPAALQTTADILRANRKSASESCTQKGLVPSPSGGEPLDDVLRAQGECVVNLWDAFLGKERDNVCSSIDSGSTTPTVAHVPQQTAPFTSITPPELPESTKQGVSKVLHQRRVASKTRLLALGAAYSVAIDQWEAKQREKEQLESEKAKGKALAEGGDAAGNGSNGEPVIAKTRAQRKREMVDAPLTPLAAGLGVRALSSDVLRSEYDLQQLLAELEQEDKRQRSREATAAVIPRMYTPEEMEERAFQSCRNSLWSMSGGGGPECKTLPLTERCGGSFACDCVVACDGFEDMVNPWSDVEKLIFMDKFMQFPKDFVRIASYLENKSPQECAEFYYLTKHVAGYKAKLKKQSVAVRKRATRNGWLLARQAASSIGVQVPKALMDGGNENGVSNVVPVLNHVCDGQFSVTKIPITPQQPIKALVDPNSGKKKKKGRDDAGTPIPTPGPTPIPTPSLQQRNQLTNFGRGGLSVAHQHLHHTVSAGGVKTTTVSAGYNVVRTGTPTLPLHSQHLTASNSVSSTMRTPVVVGATVIPVAKTPLLNVPKPSNSPVQRSSYVSKELASLVGITIPRNTTPSLGPTPLTSSTPTLAPRPGSTTPTPTPLDDQKKRKREEEMAPMAKWSNFERDEFIRLFKMHGREWTEIAEKLPSKTAAQVKNFYQNNKRVLGLEAIEAYQATQAMAQPQFMLTKPQ